MTRLSFLIAFALLLSCAFAGFSAESEGGPKSTNSILATVDGEPITLADVVRESHATENSLAIRFSGERLLHEIEQARRDILKQLILRKLVYKEYLKQPFLIPRDVIDVELATLMKRYDENATSADYERIASQNNTTVAALRKEVTINFAVTVLLHRRFTQYVNVTPKNVYEYYEAHKKDYEKAGTLSFQMLQLNKENSRNTAGAKQVADALLKQEILAADEKKFNTFVKEYSDGANRENGGIIVDFDISKLRPEFQEKLSKCKEREILGPLETPEAIFFIRVIDVNPSVSKPFEDVAEEIEDKLKSELWQKVRAEYEAELRSKSMIEEFI